jgi:prepilin-type N-terminal cleavage/methylation domain-containing protein
MNTLKLKRSRPFTLLEIVVVIALIAVMAGFGTWSLADMLGKHRRQAEAEDLKNFLQELQVEALALRSDLEVSLCQEKGTLKVRSKTAEKILRDRTVELKNVDKLTFNGQTADRKTLQILSSGRFDPPVIIGIERKFSSLWIDVTQPIQIKYSDKILVRRAEIVPAKPKKKESE